MNTDLLYRYISGYTTEEERKQIMLWIEADKSNLEKYTKLRRAYDTLAWIDNTAEYPIKKRIGARKVLLKIGKIASICLLVFLSTHYILQQFDSERQVSKEILTMSIPAGQYGEITLTDGSRVWLNSRSTLQFPSTFSSGEREVYLEGEAFFEVAADSENPFIVQTKDYSVKALGTEFNVTSLGEGEESVTSLFSGAVEIDLKKSKESYALTPNHRLAYHGEGKAIVDSIQEFSHYEWRNGFMSFENETVEKLLKRLSYCYDVTIDIKNKKILSDTYTGRFHIKDGIEQALKVLQLRSNFSYKKKGDLVTIENKY